MAKFAAFTADPVATALAVQIYQQQLRALIGEFGKRWIQDDAAPSATPEEVTRLRHAFALPILLGSLQAASDFAWETAPPGGTLAGLLETLEANLRLIAEATVADRPAGKFWLYVADEPA